jgi:hypothetical protein
LSRLGSLLTRIQSRFKDYCEFKDSCPYFDPDHFTCINNGGSHCGKYRRFKAEKTLKEPAQPNEAL